MWCTPAQPICLPWQHCSHGSSASSGSFSHNFQISSCDLHHSKACWGLTLTKKTPNHTKTKQTILNLDPNSPISVILWLLVTTLAPSAGTCNSVVAKGTQPRSLCSDIRAKIEMPLLIDTERLFRCFLSTWGNTAPVHTRGNIRHFWFPSMVGRNNHYSLALH